MRGNEPVVVKSPEHSPRIVDSIRQRSDVVLEFKKNFLERFFVRFHMTVLLLGVCASGLISTKVLLESGLRTMPLRYLIAVCVSYALFFLLIKIWLWYIGFVQRGTQASHTRHWGHI